MFKKITFCSYKETHIFYFLGYDTIYLEKKFTAVYIHLIKFLKNYYTFSNFTFPTFYKCCFHVRVFFSIYMVPSFCSPSFQSLY